jgi:hypothetical protein
MLDVKKTHFDVGSGIRALDLNYLNYLKDPTIILLI